MTKQKVEDFNKCKHICTTEKWPQELKNKIILHFHQSIIDGIHDLQFEHV